MVLPEEINLGNYQFDDFYAKAVVKVTGKKPGTLMEIKGGSCTYGITIIKSAPNKEGAVAFLEYMLDPTGGLKILKDMGQPPSIPDLWKSINDKDVVRSIRLSIYTAGGDQRIRRRCRRCRSSHDGSRPHLRTL